MKHRALLSVTNKTGLVPFAAGLAELGMELVSTGGTASTLRAAGLEVTDVASITGFPEALDGRVKTLHPMVHGGLLGDTRKDTHVRQMEEHGMVPFRVVAVNLYAFEQTVLAPHSFPEAIESIDIGGPAMVRAAAKNGENALIVVDPHDYDRVLAALQSGHVNGMHRELMAKAFRHTAFYDSMIARYLSEDSLHETFTLGLREAYPLRYGENPHQQGALYLDPLARDGAARAELLWGKDLSYNNLLDADAAWELVSDLPAGSCAIIKHGNPCGAAHGDTLAQSYELARESDPVSAFGGIAAFHGAVDLAAAEQMTAKGNFLEVVMATDYAPEALQVFEERAGWGQTVRLLRLPVSDNGWRLSVRAIRGGVLVQEHDEDPGDQNWQIVTDRQPSSQEMQALRFQWTVAQHVKSNAIVLGGPRRLYGVGAGQMNRVQSVRLALDQAGELAHGAVLASDAFFPFADSIETAAKHGITAVIQPGGSKKDSESIAAANQHGMAMIFTGTRHFRH